MQTLTFDQVEMVSGSGGAADSVAEMGGGASSVGGGLVAAGSIGDAAGAAAIAVGVGAGLLIVGGIIVFGIGAYEAYKYF